MANPEKNEIHRVVCVILPTLSDLTSAVANNKWSAEPCFAPEKHLQKNTEGFPSSAHGVMLPHNRVE